MNNTEKIKFIFFGGEPLSVPTLDILYERGFIPDLIVCNPDKPAGRDMKITPPPTKIWAIAHTIEILQPESLKDQNIIQHIKERGADFFIVVSYGKIIPKELLAIPPRGVINAHPSLLPLYRGPAPIVAPILYGDRETGVTIIQLDEKMDHGPILAQQKIPLLGNEYIKDLEKSLAAIGGNLLVEMIPAVVSGNINLKEQDHTQATYVKKMVKTDGEIRLSDDARTNWNKYRAYYGWPGVFFFVDGKRIKITEAVFENDAFVPTKVIPEGKKEMSFEEFKKHNL